ncbi:hypothetical protein [Sphingobium xenophagum]|uniref:hypothetical protein n=1 Tax=Sphingobium xenophagum TaxID=121428 RepID=UPI0036D43D78|tara:strand:+ start:9315 stop:10076 length:762 start_codon:yes stop_codon:yes gene_type:complete
MTRPLVQGQRAVESRLRLLEQKLNEELGYRDQRLRFTKLAMRSGPTTWVLRNEQVDAAGLALPQGVVAELAVARNDSSILYFGYNEEWQPARERDQIEFVSSNLRFVIAGVEDMPDLRFRLEWAGLKTDAGIVGYPGTGAAHPHWQFDVDAGWVDPATPVELAVEIDLEPAIEEVDLGDGTGLMAVAAPRRVSATLAGFHHLHLPARTMWHDLLCVMPDVATPQQHTPESHDQIDRWVISALRYLRSEFQAYM